MLGELCRDVAFEAARRSPGLNPDELWAVLEQVDAARPGLIVDVWSDPAVVWAWWNTGARVVWVPAQSDAEVARDAAPSSVTRISADPRGASTVRRVMDQCAGVRPDVVVLGGDTELSVRRLWRWFSPMVRPAGLVLVRGIARPEVSRFWAGLNVDSIDYVGGERPDGYGLVQAHGEDSISHG